MRIKHPQGAPSTNGEHAPQRERQEVTGEEFKRDILPAGWPSRFYVRIGGRIPEGAKPMSDGRLAVHAFDREDENPSAFLRDHGDGVGLYHDSRGRTCSVCDLAADEGLYSSWKDALRDVADHEGVDIGAYHIVASNGAGSSSRNGHQRNGAASHPPPAGKGESAASEPSTGSGMALDQVDWLPKPIRETEEHWLRRWLAPWCEQHKPGVTVEQLIRYGARLGIWPNKAPGAPICIGLPGYLDDGRDPVAWVFYRLDGKQFPAHKASGLTARKIHMLRGSRDSWIRDPESLAAAHTLWDCEGLSDALALSEILPEGHAAITNTAGANGDPSKLPMKFSSRKKWRNIGDLDTDGQKGAKRRAVHAARSGAVDVRLVRLPGEIRDKHGYDLRDAILDGLTFEKLERLAEQGELIDGSEDVEPAPTQKKSANRSPIDNASVSFDDDGRELVEPKTITKIVEQIQEHAGGWPKRVGESLFVADTGSVQWIKDGSALFAWFQGRSGIITWRRSVGCVTKAEMFARLQQVVPDFVAVELLPHHPPIAGHYYVRDPDSWENGDGSNLQALLERFSPESDVDAELIKAMFLTAFWGGRYGSRPAFAITASGRGKGKSRMADMVAHLAGGLVEISQRDDSNKMRTRILSPAGRTKRVVRLDNVKSERFSSSDVESIITAPVISGHDMYVGEGETPNTYMFVLTLNGPALSTDMAQRSIVVRLCKPTYAGEWESDTYRFIEENRDAIIGDILAILRGPRPSITNCLRWAAWESDILARLNNPSELQEAIKLRSDAVDAERDEIGIIEDYLESKLRWLRLDGKKVHIPNEIMHTWYCEATGDRTKRVQGVTRTMNQFIDEGRTDRLIYNPNKKNGRGFVWNHEFEGAAIYDIESRIDHMKRGDRF